MKNILRITATILIMMCFMNTVYGQKTIKGTITNDSTLVLAGVTVEVQNTTVSTISDRYGNYVISAGDDAVLVFSFSGYASQEIQIHGRNIIDVTMQHNALRTIAGTLQCNTPAIKTTFTLYRPTN